MKGNRGQKYARKSKICERKKRGGCLGRIMGKEEEMEHLRETDEKTGILQDNESTVCLYI